MREYQVAIKRTIERPWTTMEPLRLGNVPKGLGTPTFYCTVSYKEEPYLEEEPYLLLCLYGSQSYFADARIWHQWLVVGFGSYIYFLSLEKPSQQIFWNIVYFCTLYPAGEYLLATSIGKVLCFDRDTQLLWYSEEVSMDGVSISSVQDDRILVLAECPPCYDPLGRGPFLLSLHTGKIIE
ncbi:hypothetical protein KSD_72450 [Ktedonobacter sp. SOSP1-85]|uniref:hypothetical protein n=1 Tax=Ktedonobacter sp. SOSP1-85 TaxID=2778367 RepID=UPI001915D0BF|nr:hypothetical protein [Ktedonobacter sp. SOSP1-85]GHO79474.1 hypothetical protein KSD_72450 [Ktedonobacter sp. SOSP1-85]